MYYVHNLSVEHLKYVVLLTGLVKEILLFKEVGLLSGQHKGVTSTTGQHGKSAAFHFTDQTKDLIANQKAYDDANKVIHNSHDFWLSAWAKLDASHGYQNTIVSISSGDGSEEFFDLTIRLVSRFVITLYYHISLSFITLVFTLHRRQIQP